MVRNPIFTILSWKTTFDALKADTSVQCEAWNRIVSKIILTKTSSGIIYYEDVIKDPALSVSKIAKYLGVPYRLSKNFPVVNPDMNSLSYYINVRKVDAKNLESTLEDIVNICDPVAKQLGYEIGDDVDKLLQVWENENL